jgi:hypothetical protein
LLAPSGWLLITAPDATNPGLVYIVYTYFRPSDVYFELHSGTP